MPIGTIIGFLIGTYIVGLIAARANTDFAKQEDRAIHLLSQFTWMLGSAMWIISLFALVGTFIEMLIS